MLVLTQFIPLGWLMPYNENLATSPFLEWVSRALVAHTCDRRPSLTNTEYYSPHAWDF